jgi:hypothetical protein
MALPDETPEQRTITREDFYKLTGLLVLAKEHNEAIDLILRAAAQITGEEEDDVGGFILSHTGDAISQGYSVMELLDKLSLKVEAGE